MKKKHLLLAAVSVTALVAYAGPAAAQSAINIDQYLPDLDYSPENNQYLETNRGDAALTGLNQAISNVANEIQTNLPASGASLNISQGLGGSVYQGGNNDGDVIVNTVGDAVLSGIQVFESSLNTLNIPGVASGGSAVDVTFGQQYDFSSGGSGIDTEIDQYTDNHLYASGGTGNVAITADQIGQNTRNIATIAADGLDTVTGAQYFGTYTSDQDIANNASSYTDIGNASVDGAQQAFNIGNSASVNENADSVALTQIIAEASGNTAFEIINRQYANNETNVRTYDVGNASASVDQTAVNRVNRASVADVTGTFVLDQDASDMFSVGPFGNDAGQKGNNTVYARGGNIGGGTANIILAAADADSAGGGQVVTNSINSGSFGSVGTLSANQTADDIYDNVGQSASNRLFANDLANAGSSVITATGSRGQAAFNTINTLTGDLGTVGSGSLDQTSVNQYQSARNTAEAYGGNIGSASITGLTQSAGSIINSIKLPVTP